MKVSPECLYLLQWHSGHKEWNPCQISRWFQWGWTWEARLYYRIENATGGTCCIWITWNVCGVFWMVLVFTGYSEQIQKPRSGFSMVKMITLNNNPETGFMILGTWLGEGIWTRRAAGDAQRGMECWRGGQSWLCDHWHEAAEMFFHKVPTLLQTCTSAITSRPWAQAACCDSWQCHQVWQGEQQV